MNQENQFFTDCTRCKDAREKLAALMKAVYETTGEPGELRLEGRYISISKAYPEDIVIECGICGTRGKVPTAEARELLQWMREEE